MGGFFDTEILNLTDTESAEKLHFKLADGPIAQLVERIVCNDEVSSSNLLGSTLNHSCRQNGLQPVIACTSGSGQAL